MGLLSNLFGRKRKKLIKKFKERGAVIIDVRNPNEFASEHSKGSKNIPLSLLKKEIPRLKKISKPIIVCCASGIRSSNAKLLMEKAGIEVVNAGGWRRLK